MAELKTLKEIAEEHIDEHNMYIVDELQKEAINWIKELEKSKEAVKKAYSNSNLKEILVGKSYEINWIKHFFNIEKEDLE